ncbi:hypothetical protein FBU31_001569 [Coemansia sp. 'formosensis']|nr:hypothetical protein FBU31_001569 [Coemansia sp. 'formosensis']
MSMLAIAPVPETPCITSLTAPSADDSDDSVQISLGIQQGISQAWRVAIDKLGSMSLAWQSEGASAQGGLTQPVDPALVFDGVSKPTANLLAQRPPGRSTTPDSRLYKRKDVAISRFIAPAIPAWHLKGPPSIIFEDTTSDSARFNSRQSDNMLPEPPARHSPSGATSNALIAPLSARASRKVSNHRLSIKLERLLPPRTPNSGTIALHTPALATRSARGLPRRCSILSDQVATRRRASSQPPPATNGSIFICQRGITDITSSAASVSAQQGHVAPMSDGGDNKCSLYDEQRLELLEAQVSDMFCELGLRSPYIQSSRPAEQRTLTGSVHRGPEQAPWFYQSRYTESAPREEKLARHVILFDDDSSSPDNAADSIHRCHSHSSHRYGDAAQMSFPSLQSRRRTTTSSVLSAVDESIGSTAAASGSSSNTVHNVESRPHVESVCFSHDLPCHQIHSLQQRIGQADQYIRSVSRHASTISSMLTDLRKQSQALVETLAISQARATPSPNQLPLDSSFSSRQLLPQHKRAKRAGEFAAGPALGDPIVTMALMSKTCSRPRNQKTQGVVAVTQCLELASISADTNETSSPIPPGSAKQAREPKRVKSKRPIQPVPVRLRRIDAQWSELCEILSVLGIDMAATNATVEASEQTLRHSATDVAVGGLKSIQRVLKNTLESLSALNVRQISGTGDTWTTL